MTILDDLSIIEFVEKNLFCLPIKTYFWGLMNNQSISL
jgi:hypothetical protein